MVNGNYKDCMRYPRRLWRLGSNAVNNTTLNLENFSQTKNTCYGNPLKNLDTYGIANTS